ncbi:hypothetical protein, partial [Candidatus Erwinia dacicola]
YSLLCRHFCRSVDAMWTLILKIPFNQLFKHLTFPLMEGLTSITNAKAVPGQTGLTGVMVCRE